MNETLKIAHAIVGMFARVYDGMYLYVIIDKNAYGIGMDGRQTKVHLTQAALVSDINTETAIPKQDINTVLEWMKNSEAHSIMFTPINIMIFYESSNVDDPRYNRDRCLVIAGTNTTDFNIASAISAEIRANKPGVASIDTMAKRG